MPNCVAMPFSGNRTSIKENMHDRYFVSQRHVRG